MAVTAPKYSGFKIITAVLCFIIFGNVGSVSAQSMQTDFSRGAMFYHQGNFEEAIDAFQIVVKKNSASVEGYIYLASAQLGAKEYQHVIETTQKGLQIDSLQIRLLLLKAEACYRTDYQKAFPVYHQAEHLLKQRPGNTMDGIKLAQIKATLGQLYQRRANEFFKKGLLDKSIIDYKKARTYSPDSLDINNNLAYTLIKAEKWDEAIALLNDALKYFPDDKKLLLMQGQAYGKSKKPNKMVNSYKTLYEKDTKNLNHAIIYGQSLMMANRAQEANLFFHNLLKKYPKEKKLYEVFKKISARRYDFSAKRNILKLQRKAFPDDISVAEELAQTHVLIKEYREARQIYDSLAISTHQFKYYLQGARTWLFEKKYEQAENDYQTVIKQFPRKSEALIDLALIYKEKGESMKARDLFERVIDNEPDPENTVKLVEILVEQDRISRALNYTDRLKATPYSGIGVYYKLKYGRDISAKNVRQQKMQHSFVCMLQLYSSIQKNVKASASEVIKVNGLLKPPLLQHSKELKHIRAYISNWYEYLSETYAYNESSEILDNIKTSYPSSAMVYLFKGKIDIRNNKLNTGIESLKESIRLGAKDPKVYVLLGDAYSGTNKIHAAIVSYERAITFDKYDEEAYRNLVKLSQKNDLLDALCNRWLTRYGNNKDNELLKKYLIEALHKADRFKEAKKIIEAS